MSVTINITRKISPAQWFMLSSLLVNVGNYVYNLILGRLLGPEAFADAAVMVTFLLILSFIAMTFQLTVARFIAEVEEDKQSAVYRMINNWSLRFGITVGILVMAFAKNLQTIFHTSSSEMFMIFGASLPLYFIMSTNRGNFQGRQELYKLSYTYQGEMIARLSISLLLIYLLNWEASILIAIGIAVSFLIGLFPYHKNKSLNTLNAPYTPNSPCPLNLRKSIMHFLLITALYEGTQIIINNSDILLVKHYFPSYDAGLYAALALIGRAVYFVTWMFVMILLPKVVEAHKNGLPHASLLYSNLKSIGILCLTIVLGCFLFPKLAVSILFGEAYLDVAYLLGPYAVATSLFALANVFVYYSLSLSKYKPVFLASVFGILQVSGIIFLHDSLLQVVLVQIGLMSIHLCLQVIYFLRSQINR